MNDLPTPAEIMAKEPRLIKAHDDLMLQINVQKSIGFGPGFHFLVKMAENQIKTMVGEEAENPELRTRMHHAVMLDYLIGKMKEELKA